MRPSIDLNSLKREESTLLPKEYYFIVFEGRRTEPEYFACLEKKDMLKAQVVYQKVDKDCLDENNTFRKQLIEIAIEEKNYLETGRRGIYSLVTALYKEFFQQFRDDEIFSKDYEENEWRKKKLRSVMEYHLSFREKIIRKLRRQKITKLEDVICFVVNELNKKFGKYFEPENHDYYIPQESRDVLKDGVYVYIMCDRDAWCDEISENGRYFDNLKLCSEHGIGVIMTYPQFELWLLLHHPGVDPSCCPDLVGKIIELEDDVSNKTEVKRITLERFEKYYMYHIGDAIHAVKKFGLCSDLKNLESQYGTNFGIFLEKILKPEYLKVTDSESLRSRR